MQPHHQGKLLFLTGAPGLGKSTTAQLLARRLGYVYYECDTFAQLKNPFIDVNVENPSIAQLKQKILKGINLISNLVITSKCQYFQAPETRRGCS